jgi:hypothetical protein
MNAFAKGLLLGAALNAIVTLGIYGCTKQVDPIVAQPAVQAVVATPATPVVVGPQEPTTQLEKQGAVKVETKVVETKVVKAPTKVVKAKPDGEAAAYAKAKNNAARAKCLRETVDAKIDADVKAGSYRDFGNILTYHKDVCHYPKASATPRGAKAHGAKKHSIRGHKTPVVKKVSSTTGQLIAVHRDGIGSFGPRPVQYDFMAPVVK